MKPFFSTPGMTSPNFGNSLLQPAIAGASMTGIGGTERIREITTQRESFVNQRNIMNMTNTIERTRTNQDERINLNSTNDFQIDVNIDGDRVARKFVKKAVKTSF